MGILQRLGAAFRGFTLSGSAHPRDPMLADLFGGGATTTAGVTVTPNNARECPEVDACIGLLEDTVATLPLDLFARTSDGSRERLADHPLHVLLHDRPNEWQTSAEFRQMLEGWRLTHGNAYARIVPGGVGGFPAALEPIHPDEVRAFIGPNGGAFYRWTPPAGDARVLTQGEMLHLRDRPAKRSNKLEGESRIVRHREAIGLATATGEYLSRFFSGNAVPKAAVILPPGAKLDDDQKRKLKEAWERRHGGLENAHRIAILEGGMDIKPIGLSNDDAQVIQAYELAVSRIARIFGIPLHLIGETAKSTSWGTGIEQQSIGFVVYYMRPKLVVWEQALNRALMSSATRSQLFFEFNIDGLLRGDFKSRMDGYAIMIQWGLATPNEIRRLMNLAPLTGGDERLTPLNMVPASRIMDVLLKTSGGSQTRDLDAADEATSALISLIAAANKRLLNGPPEFTQ